MKALITGASSGLGKDFAKILSEKGYEIILVSRDQSKLEKVKKELKTDSRIICTDLSNDDNCIQLFNKIKNEDIDIVINNAGFGVFGNFNETLLEREIEMINTNIKAVHILTKLFYEKFIKENKGYILNVSSSAAFQPGPLMATYYASKSYVYNLTCAIYEEARRKKSKVKLSVLCPGPVDTNFNNVANVKFSIKALNSYDVAKYAVDKMFKNKLLIIPGFTIKLAHLFGKFLSVKQISIITYNIQRKKVR